MMTQCDPRNANGERSPEPHPERDRNTRARRLALAHVRELRRAGLSFRDIGRLFRPSHGSDPVDASGLGPQRPLTPLLPLARWPAGATPDHRDFLRALDAVPAGIAFFDDAGLLLHLNRSFTQMFGADREGSRLQHEILHFASSLGSLIRTRGALRLPLDAAEELGERTTRTADAHYRLRGSRIGIDLFGLGPSLLVTLERVASVSLSDEALRDRFDLTRQECLIARLLAEGRSNAGIAAELGISLHTARHHTESVLLKLGIRSRAEVGHKLRDG